MAKARYAIVKVNNHCPSRFVDNVKNEYVCKIKQAKDGYHLNCVGCRYGDTKEQMIKKIAQILFQESPHNVLYTNPDKVVNEFFYNDCLKTATKIVEFLGVE